MGRTTGPDIVVTPPPRYVVAVLPPRSMVVGAVPALVTKFGSDILDSSLAGFACSINAARHLATCLDGGICCVLRLLRRSRHQGGNIRQRPEALFPLDDRPADDLCQHLCVGRGHDNTSDRPGHEMRACWPRHR